GKERMRRRGAGTQHFTQQRGREVGIYRRPHVDVDGGGEGFLDVAAWKLCFQAVEVRERVRLATAEAQALPLEQVAVVPVGLVQLLRECAVYGQGALDSL